MTNITNKTQAQDFEVGRAGVPVRRGVPVLALPVRRVLRLRDGAVRLLGGDPQGGRLSAVEGSARPSSLTPLLDRRAEFLRFLERRLPNRAAAEEVLQAAYVKAVEHEASLEDLDRVVPWFYRILRNALADEIRRKTTAGKTAERLAAEPEAVDDADLHRAVCTCVTAILPTLTPAYADILRRTEIEGGTLASVADDLGTNANNLAVRAHRARAALRKKLTEVCGACSTHGCLDCTCRAKPF